jgi:glyoxylase-like metal-dependent hydrolase (beta-lactamase superfamily II)
MSAPVTANLLRVSRFGNLLNAYLVREEDGFTLVDALLGKGDAQRLLRAARDANGAVRRIAFTHGHGDHVGALDALKDQLGGDVEVLMPALDAQILAGEAYADKKPPGSWPKVTTVPDVRLAAGDRVGSLEVVPTPGHTPGHVSFLDTRDRSVITGDVFVSVGGLAVSNHFHLPFPFAAMATWDKQQDLASAKRIADLAPSRLAFGHGAPLEDPGAALSQAISKAAG